MFATIMNTINMLKNEFEDVYFKTNKVIGKQSIDDLKIIMKSIYLSNRSKLSDHINIIEL